MFFLVLSYRPGRPKGPKSFFRKRPGITANAGASFFTCIIKDPQRAFTRILRYFVRFVYAIKRFPRWYANLDRLKICQ